MAGDEVFLMTSLVLILAVFLRRMTTFLSQDAANVSTNGEDATDFGTSGQSSMQNIRNRRKHKIVEHICAQKRVLRVLQYRHHEIGKVLAEELRDLMRPEEL